MNVLLEGNDGLPQPVADWYGSSSPKGYDIRPHVSPLPRRDGLAESILNARGRSFTMLCSDMIQDATVLNVNDVCITGVIRLEDEC